MEVFKRLDIEFDYTQLRKDVVSTFESIRDKAYGTDNHVLATRNQCLTVSQPDSDDWLDGVAGKTIINKTRPKIIGLLPPVFPPGINLLINF